MCNSLDIILKVMMNHSKVRVEQGIIIFDFPKTNSMLGVKGELEGTRGGRQVLKDTKMNVKAVKDI